MGWVWGVDLIPSLDGQPLRWLVVERRPTLLREMLRGQGLHLPMWTSWSTGTGHSGADVPWPDGREALVVLELIVS